MKKPYEDFEMTLKSFLESEIREIGVALDSSLHPPGRIKTTRLQGMLTAYQNVLKYLADLSGDNPYYKGENHDH